MNIFYTNSNPITCATILCDQHIIKMPIESAQMLATAVRSYGITDHRLYRSTHVKHPCTIWVRNSRACANWLLDHGYALCEEYTNRFNKRHKTLDQLHIVKQYLYVIPDGPFSEPPACVPEQFKHLNIEAAYRSALAKKHIEWTLKGRPPRWTEPAYPTK